MNRMMSVSVLAVLIGMPTEIAANDPYFRLGGIGFSLGAEGSGGGAPGEDEDVVPGENEQPSPILSDYRIGAASPAPVLSGYAKDGFGDPLKVDLDGGVELMALIKEQDPERPWATRVTAVLSGNHTAERLSRGHIDIDGEEFHFAYALAEYMSEAGGTGFTWGSYNMFNDGEEYWGDVDLPHGWNGNVDQPKGSCAATPPVVTIVAGSETPPGAGVMSGFSEYDLGSYSGEVWPYHDLKRMYFSNFGSKLFEVAVSGDQREYFDDADFVLEYPDGHRVRFPGNLSWVDYYEEDGTFASWSLPYDWLGEEMQEGQTYRGWFDVRPCGVEEPEPEEPEEPDNSPEPGTEVTRAFPSTYQTFIAGNSYGEGPGDRFASGVDVYYIAENPIGQVLSGEARSDVGPVGVLTDTDENPQLTVILQGNRVGLMTGSEVIIETPDGRRYVYPFSRAGYQYKVPSEDGWGNSYLSEPVTDFYWHRGDLPVLADGETYKIAIQTWAY